MESEHNINSLGLLVADHVSAMLAYWDKDLICRFAKGENQTFEREIPLPSGGLRLARNLA